MLFKLVIIFSVTCAINAQILPPTGIRRVRPGPVIQTPVGPIQGQEETYDLLRRIYTFKGIKYANAERFRMGVAPPSYNSTYQAWQNGPECPQIGGTFNRVTGDEDCLYLNIATPTNIRSRLPVVFSIHGGGLQFGNGEIDTFGPEHINRENVIFVSINYRLNVFGFLNTQNDQSPGNYGLKDMIMALQWVQRNIESFGGNRDDVTIWGISGGGVGVHALVVSQAARGLFHKAVSHSGSLFNPWAFTRNPRNSINWLIERLQLQVSGDADLVNQLRQVSVARLMEAVGPAIIDSPRSINEIPFNPSMDPFFTPEIRIFTAPIELLISSGSINRVPYVIGFNSHESMYMLSDIFTDSTILERFNQNPHLLVPTEWNLPAGSQEALAVITAFRSIYFHGATNLTPEQHAQGWMEYISDREFIFGVSKQARLHREHQDVYYFRFSYSGSLSFAQRLAGLSGVDGAMHGDDQFYMFRMNTLITPVLPGDEAFTIQRRLVRLWTNFFKYGNPTPTLIDPLINTLWPILSNGTEFLDIGRILTVDSNPFNTRMNVWHALDQLYGDII